MTYEAQLTQLIGSIREVDPGGEARAWERLDTLTKPPRSLGKLESVAARAAAVQQDVRPCVKNRAIVLAAADHGVTAEGVSPYPQDVTWQMVANFAAGGAAINQLAASVGARLCLIDVGVRDDTACLAQVRQERIRSGTANMAEGPAMTREEAAGAVMVGAGVVRELVADGVTCVGTGEMGIGNTTAASALTSVLTGVLPAAVVGRGTGLDDAGLRRKAEVIQRALEVNQADPNDPLGVLAALGGLEIAALVGVYLGAAEQGILVVMDGFVTGAALLVAARMQPSVLGYAFASHRSVEPGHTVQLDELRLDPVLELDMRLGEGTGAALAMGIIDAACGMIGGMATFSEAGVSEKGE